jgi:hypothetical protein
MTRLRALSTNSQASSPPPNSRDGSPEKQTKGSPETATGTSWGRVSIAVRNLWNSALAGEREVLSMPVIIGALELPAPLLRALVGSSLDSVRGANDSR